ncbi:MAG: hypothetical protein GX816_00070 [Erysipelotrichia bacterium]|jgi:V/A-type H+-transporting ATPase subunit F|nr:hypothetical protein [Erysipelotrichia bacterium]
MKDKLVAIAKSENVYFFRGLGFTTYLADDEIKMRKVLDELTKDTQLIVIDEKLQSLIGDYRRRISDKAFPIIVALPIDESATGQGLEKLRDDVEKAIGLKLF